VLLDVACLEHEVEALHRVQNVDDVVVRVLLEVALRHLAREGHERLQVDVGELERAKSAAIHSVLMNLESRAVVAEDIGRQVLTYGHRKPVPEFIKEIKNLTPSDVASAVSRLIKTSPTLAAIGDIAGVPRYDIIAKRFA